MNVERVRAVLGVWAPMAIGLFIILTSINFYFTATLAGGVYVGDLESWRFVCSVGAFFVGAVLLLSTYGRYRKTVEARRERPPVPPSIPLAAPPDHERRDDEGDHDHQDD